MRPQLSRILGLAGVLLCPAVECLAHGAVLRRVSGGTTTVSLHEPLMNRLGLRVVRADPSATDHAALERPLSFDVLPDSTLQFLSEHDIVVQTLGGSLIHRGGLVLAAGEYAMCLPDLVLDFSSATGQMTVAEAGAPQNAVFALPDATELFQSHDDGTVVALLDLRIAPELAAELGDADLAGLAIGQAVIRLDVKPFVRRPNTETRTAAQTPRGGVLDLALFTIGNLQEVARDGAFPDGISGMAMSTTSCNVGDVNITWQAPMAEVHPFIIQNVYRLLGGRLDQIGAADVKHGFFSTNSAGCGVCQDPGMGSVLGPGCSDTYSTMNNANRHFLAPRHEVNPYAGTWECEGTHFSGGVPDCIRRHGAVSLHTPTEHMIEIVDGDLGLPGATYYYEGYYIVGGDQDKSNNIGWRTATPSWNGSTWIAATTSGFTLGAVIDTWGEQRTTVSDGAGQVTLAVTTTDLGGGQYRYEYALFNFDLERRIRSFTLPAGGVNVSNPGFHDPDDELGNDWVFQFNGNTITWFTDTFAQDPLANALIYGTLYTFWFDADAAPTTATVTLGLFKPGAGTAVAATTLGPPRGMQDCNGNSVDDLDDITGGTSTDCDMNLTPDECDPDCNGSGLPDNCDIFEGTSSDCQPNGVPDECELAANDCNTNGIVDFCDIAGATSLDCQPNGTPDECELDSGSSPDINSNGIPDECDPDCNGNTVPDDLDIGLGTSTDCNANLIPDECEPDCNTNGITDECDITAGTSLDENANGVPDECDCRCGDLNRDGIINLEDFATFASCFGFSTASPPPACPPGDARCSDFTGDGEVDLADFATFGIIFQQAPPPPSECFF